MDPNEQLNAGLPGGPPPAGTNSIWSTIDSIVKTATGAFRQVETTIQSTQLPAGGQFPGVITKPAPDYKMWAIVGLVVIALIAWLK